MAPVMARARPAAKARPPTHPLKTRAGDAGTHECGRTTRRTMSQGDQTLSRLDSANAQAVMRQVGRDRRDRTAARRW